MVAAIILLSVAVVVLLIAVRCRDTKIGELENSLNRKHEYCQELERRCQEKSGDLTSLRAMKQYFDDWLDEMPQFLMNDFMDRQRENEDDAEEAEAHEQ